MSTDPPRRINWKASLKALLRPLRIETDVHCEIDLRGDIPDWPDPPGITIDIGTEAETMQAADMRLRDAGENVHAEFRDRLARGQKCFVARRGTEVVGCNWLLFHHGWEGPVRMDLRPDEVMCQDAFTAISARGRSVHTALQHAMIAWAKAQGYRTAYTFARLVDPLAHKPIKQMHWRHETAPRYRVISSPLLRQFGIRHQIVSDHTPGRHPIARGPLLRRPPFEREPWEW